MHRWKSYLKGLNVKLLWLLNLKTSLGSWSLSCAGKHCLFKGFWDAWRGAYNRAYWGWKELDFILHWHLQIATKESLLWQSLFLETASYGKKNTEKNRPCFFGEKLTVKWVRPKGQPQKTHLFILNKNPTSNLSDLIYGWLTIIFRKQVEIMEKHLYWQHDAVRNFKPPKKRLPQWNIL